MRLTLTWDVLKLTADWVIIFRVLRLTLTWDVLKLKMVGDIDYTILD